MSGELNPDTLPDAPAETVLDPDTLPDAHPAGQASEPVRLNAWKASKLAGGAPAAAAIGLSRDSGFTPEHVAENLPEFQQEAARQRLNATLDANPGLAAYAGQSAAHAAAVKDEARPLSWIEKHITGRWEMAEGESYYDPASGVPLVGGPQPVETPGWMKALDDSVAEQLLVVRSSRALFGDATDLEQSQLADIQRQVSLRQEEKDKESLAEKAFLFPLRGALYIGGLAASSVVGGAAAGPVGAFIAPFGFNIAQNAGPLYLQLRDLKDEDGAIVMSDDDARLYAVLGGSAAATVGTLPGMEFVKRVPGMERLLASAIARSMVNAPLMKALTENALVRYGKHVLAGGLMMGLQAGAQRATVELARSNSGLDADPVAIAQDFGHTFVEGALGSLLIAGLSPAGKLLTPERKAVFEVLGQADQARRDSQQLGSAIALAKDLKLPADEARQVFQHMADQPGAATKVHVDLDAWNGHFGDLAAKIHADIAGDGGKSYAEARAAGTPVEVPIADHLARLSKDGHAEALLQDSKLDGDGLTPREAAEAFKGMTEALTREDARRFYSGIPQDEQQGLPGTLAQDLSQKVKDRLNRKSPTATVDQRSPAPEPGASPGVEMPAEVKVIFDAHLQREAFQKAARDILNDKPLAEISPGRYERAASKAVDKAIQFASEPDKGIEKVIGQYAKVADMTAEAAREALAAARSGFQGAGLQAGSGGELGQETLRAAGKQAAGAEKTLGKADVATQKLAQIEDQHAALQSQRRQRLNELKAQKTLAEELAAAAVEIREKMDKAGAQLAKRYTDEHRATLAKAGREFLDVSDSLMEAVGLAPASSEVAGRLRLDDLVARMESDAVPVGFDVEGLRAIIDAPREWKKLTPAEAQNVLDAVKQLRHVARDAVEVQIGDRRASVRARVTAMRDHLDQLKVPDSGLPAPSEAGKTLLERAKKKAGKIAAEGLRAEVILRRFGPEGEAIHDAFVGARNKKEELDHQVGQEIYKAYETGMPKALKKIRFDGVDGPASPVVADNKWVRQDLWNLAGWLGSESGAERALGGLRIDEMAARQALSQLTAKEVDFINASFKLNDEKLWPLVKAHEEKYGIAPRKIDARPFQIRTVDGELKTIEGGYWPGKENREAAAPGTSTVADYWGSMRDLPAAVSKSFTKERVAHAEYVPDLNWSAYAGHINSVLHYLAYDDFVRGGGRIFRDKEFRDLARQRLGEGELRELDAFMEVAARGHVEAPTGGARELSRLIGDGFRGRLATAAFQLNPTIVVSDLSKLVSTMFSRQISPLDMTVGIGKALQPETWAEAHANSKQLPYRWNNYGGKMREVLSNIGPGEQLAGRKWVDTASQAMYHVMDGLLSKIIWEASVSKHRRKNFTDEAAFHAADADVSAVMPPLNLAEQSSLARDRGVLGALLLVRNFPNTLYNLGAAQAWQARTKVWAANQGLAKVWAGLGATTTAAILYLATTMSEQIFGDFLMGRGRKEDETTGEWAARTALAAPFYPFPFVSDVATLAAEPAVTDKTLKQAVFGDHSIRAAPALAMLSDALKNMATAVDENAEPTDRYFSGLKLAATAFRLPNYPLRPLRYGTDLARGETSPRGPFDVAGGFFYGERPKQPKNPLTAAQDIVSGD